MSYHNLNAYQQVETSTILNENPYQLILHLYRSALEKLVLAKGQLNQTASGIAGESISKAIAIFEYLNSILCHHERGMTQNLSALYDYMCRRLLYVTLKKDIDALNEVISLLKKILEGWEGIPTDIQNHDT